MDGRIDLWNPFLIDPRDQNMNSPEYSNGESPPPAMFSGQKKSSAPSPKRSSKRGIEKRVVSIPIKEVEGSRVKGESNTAPPSDTWAWRKYGQKPIKGSPYPRGYYRCSSSKGCPARKQVERSSVDPSMLVITYSSEHNHPWPASRNPHHPHHHSSPSTSDKPSQPASLSDPPEPDRGDNKFTDVHADDSLITDGLGWVGEWDIESVSPTLFQSPVSTGSCAANDADLAMFFPVAMGEEADDSLFADLGELPECSVVFRRELVGRAPAAWCGTTS